MAEFNEQLKNPKEQDRLIQGAIIVAANIHGDEAVTKAIQDGTFKELMEKTYEQLKTQEPAVLKGFSQAQETLKGQDIKQLSLSRETNTPEINQSLDKVNDVKKHQNKKIYAGLYLSMQENTGMSDKQFQERTQANLEPVLEKPRSIVVSNNDPEQVKQAEPTDDLDKDIENNQLSIEKLKAQLEIAGLSEDKRSNAQELLVELSKKQELLIEKRKDSTKRSTTASVNAKPEKGLVEERDIPPVKEDDIINYMYNEWLLGLTNYGIKKGFYGIDLLLDKIEREVLFKQDHLKPEATHTTPKILKGFESTVQKDFKKSVNGTYDGQLIRDTATSIRNGEYMDNPDISDEHKQLISNLSPEQIQTLFSHDRTEDFITKFQAMDKRIAGFASIYAGAQIYNREAKGELELGSNETIADAFQKEKKQAYKDMLKWLAHKTIENGNTEDGMQKTFDEFQEMLNNAQSGYAKATEQVNNGRYHDNDNPDKPYQEPQELTKAAQQLANGRNTEELTLYESVLNNQNAEFLKKQYATAKQEEILKQRELDQHNERRDEAAERANQQRLDKGLPESEAFANTSEPEHTTEPEQTKVNPMPNKDREL